MMTIRGFIYFLLAFTTVVVLGLVSGCSSADYHESHVSTGYRFVQYCGFARCDGKENR